jgi:hypothetical protein
MARQKKPSKKRQAELEAEAARINALPIYEAARARAEEQAEFEQRIKEISLQDAEINARKKAAYEAAQPLGWSYTRNVMGMEPVPGTTDRWRRIRPKGIRGPLKGSGVINDTNKWKILDMMIEYGREIVDGDDWPTKYGVAQRFSKYGISGRDQVTAEKAIDRLIKKCDPSWTWKNDILPRIRKK